MSKWSLPQWLAKLLTHNFLSTIKHCQENNIPWQRPYILPAQPRSIATGKNYRGINVLMLLISAYLSNWQDPRWGTKHRWRALGGRVSGGSEGTLAVSDGGGKLALYNAEQCNWGVRFPFSRGTRGIEPVEQPKHSLAESIEIADTYLNSAGADIKYSNRSPYYNIKKDYINLLHQESYLDTETSTAAESFYSAWSHELIHWTGHKDRNHREMSGDHSSDSYAFEELIAEVGSILLCQKLGIGLAPRLDNVTYMASWLKLLSADHNALRPRNLFIKATKHAQNAVDYIDQITDINLGENQE